MTNSAERSVLHWLQKQGIYPGPAGHGLICLLKEFFDRNTPTQYPEKTTFLKTEKPYNS